MSLRRGYDEFVYPGRRRSSNSRRLALDISLKPLWDTLEHAMNSDPMTRTKDEYAAIVEHISVANSPVGIDAQLTHAIIITYLQQIEARLEKIEARLERGA